MRGVSFLPAILAVLVVVGLAPATPAAARARPDPMEMLENADANRDGAISRAEFIDARRARFAKMDRNGDGYFSDSDLPRIARKRAGDRIDRLMSGLDRDRDGRLGRDEFVNGPTRLFDAADRDRNGLLDRAEIDAMRKAAAARSGG